MLLLNKISIEVGLTDIKLQQEICLFYEQSLQKKLFSHRNWS